MEKIIIKEFGEEVYNFLSKHVDWKSEKTLVLCTSTIFNIENQPQGRYDSILNLKKINNILRINRFFIEINTKLPENGVFIGAVETYPLRVKRFFIKYPKFIAILLYMFWFLYKRIFPKLPLFKKMYFFFTRGVDRVVSKAEALGRLVSCGFEIIEYKECNNVMYFVVKKVKVPAENYQPSYGPIFKMRRVGKGGKIIYVYKFRTMHPYAEFLQDYILKVNGYSDIAKPANDFRLTDWGKFFRKYWLDELPQLFNVLKGEMRLVGVRPVSERFLKEYPEDIREMRLKHKPGCVPPYVALYNNRKKKEEKDGDCPFLLKYIDDEREYLRDFEKNPYTTDIKYFFKAFYNIFFKKITSS